jgi:hypothetical protein
MKGRAMSNHKKTKRKKIVEASEMDTPRTDKQIALGGSAAEKATNKCDAKFARQLERELNQAIKERDEARNCLREAVNDMIGRRDCMTIHDGSEAYYKATEAIDRWREAAGLTNGKMDKKVPTINQNDENSTNHIRQFVLGKDTAQQLLNYFGVSSYVVYQMNVTKHFSGEVDISYRLYDAPTVNREDGQ